MTDRAGRPGPKPRLSPELIVAAAFRVTERGGAAALTFTALGRELDAHPTAVYRHFRDRDDLMRSLVDALQAEVLAEAPDSMPEDWVEQLRVRAMATHRVFMRHPQIAQEASVRSARLPNEYRIIDETIGVFRRAGLGERDAARCYRVYSDFVLAYSAQDAALVALKPETLAGDLEAWENEYRTLGAAEYPNIASVSDQLPALDDPGNFALALDLVLEGLRAYHAKATAGR
jgi:AcrR family transcriptional regulator